MKKYQGIIILGFFIKKVGFWPKPCGSEKVEGIKTAFVCPKCVLNREVLLYYEGSINRHVITMNQFERTSCNCHVIT
jgi:hypothetical protein